MKQIFTAILLIAPAVLNAQTAPAPLARPRLVIEPGGHTGAIRAVSVDSTERFALTASADKTARLWDLQSMSLLQTFRPASNTRAEGALNAAALSPDAALVVLGGSTGPQWTGDGSYGFLVYGRAGNFITSVGGFAGPVNHIQFTRDGQFLAVSAAVPRGFTPSAPGGAKIFRVSDWTEVASDPEGRWISLARYRNERRAYVLIGSRRNSAIRSYRLTPAGWTRLAEVEAPGEPFWVDASADGMHVAAGTQLPGKQYTAALYSGEGLENRTELENVASAFFTSGAFSADGTKFLRSGDSLRFEVWDSSGAGEGQVWNVSKSADAINAMAPLRDGRVVYGTEQGDWGIAARPPAASRQVRSTSLGVVERITPISVSFDGSELQYRGYSNDKGFVFSLRNNAIVEGGTLDASSGPPVSSDKLKPIAFDTSKGELAPPGWTSPLKGFQSDSLVSNGRNIVLQNQIADGIVLQDTGLLKCVPTASARFPDAIYLQLCGAIHAFRPDGTRLWTTMLPEGLEGLRIPQITVRSGDGRHVIVAGSDGVFHWYSAANGRPEMNLYVTKDHARWVAWTPAGYYMASPGGEGLVGWQVNRDNKGPDADIYPVARFRTQYARPAVLLATLSTNTPAEALRAAGVTAPPATQARGIETRLPPVVTILSPDSNSTASGPTVTVKYALNSATEPITKLTVRIDGRPMESRGAVSADRSVQVAVPSRDCEISLVAENRFGSSEAAAIKIRWAGTKAASSKPTLYVLSIGVSAYQDASLKLGLPAKDATDLANAFKEQQGAFYGNVLTTVLTNEKATRSGVLRALSELRRNAKQGDFVVVFFSGHGAADDSNTYYYLPVDADPHDLLTTSVRFSEISELIAQIPARTVMFVDTCHSGNLSSARLNAIADINSIANGLSDGDVGAVVFTASTGKQLALEDPAWGNGAFTKALLEGLRGNAVDGGEVTISTLERWVGKRVNSLTCGRQTPVCSKRVPDFTIASGAPAAAPPAVVCK